MTRHSQRVGKIINCIHSSCGQRGRQNVVRRGGEMVKCRECILWDTTTVCAAKIVHWQIGMTVDQQQPFLLHSYATLLSSRDVFRQRKEDYQSIFIPVLQIYIATQAIRRSGDGTGSQGPNVLTTSLLYDRTVLAWSGQSSEGMNKKRIQCFETAAGARPWKFSNGSNPLF